MVFGTNFTSSAPTNPGKNTGEGMADFFLGLPTAFGRGLSSGGWEQTSRVFSGYGQDTWRGSVLLTLTLCLRSESDTPRLVTKHHQDNYTVPIGHIEVAGQNRYNAAP